MTQEQLCEKTGKKLSASRIANYEQGTREVGIDEAKILAEALEVPACYLMGLIDEMDRQLLEYDVAIKMKIIETMKVAYRPLEERLAESVRRVTPAPRHPTVKRRMRR
jgi:transcriptional regulator with XRE-family HTH domain